MGVILSCCFNRGNNAENESLLQNGQNGYGSGALNDYDAAQRQLEEEEQKMIAREQELTQIVNNTNDKLIDISMMSNSGIVVQRHDLSDLSNTTEHSSEENASTDKKKAVLLQSVDPAVIDASQRERCKQLFNEFFDSLQEQLQVKPAGKLIVSL
ncbi:LAMI_0F11100g1_1 [Lachancea mirantina]|uniref:LAMI_0F11100g1_1 n=1 Tax=Lachancea mirantina TaxID=1230905 RepID=A0A1G4K287_9SACH|nr:LAMI_0F11100g1_1 [Lachancea mirantina]